MKMTWLHTERSLTIRQNVLREKLNTLPVGTGSGRTGKIIFLVPWR
jgi:hypothetical protein